MSHLRSMANRMDEGVTESLRRRVYGAFLDIIMTVLPIFLQLFQNCPAKKPKPEPVNPTPTPTAEQSQAWSQAWALKCRAEDGYDDESREYSNRLLRPMARAAMKAHKKKGERLSKVEALEIAHESLEEARTQPMGVLYAAVLEATPIVLNLPAFDFHVITAAGEEDEAEEV